MSTLRTFVYEPMCSSLCFCVVCSTNVMEGSISRQLKLLGKKISCLFKSSIEQCGFRVKKTPSLDDPHGVHHLGGTATTIPCQGARPQVPELGWRE